MRVHRRAALRRQGSKSIHSTDTLMHVRKITDPAQWLGELSSWPSDRKGHPMRSVAWLGSWWQQFGGSSELYALHVYDDAERLIAALPLYRSEGILGGALESIGNGRACTDHVTLLTEADTLPPEQLKRVTSALAGWLIDAADDDEDSWQLMEIDGVATGDAMVLSLAEQLSARGAIVHAVSPMSLWRLDLPPSLDDYLRSLTKNQRKNLRRDFKALETTGGFEIRRATATGDIDTAFDTLTDLHRRRWSDGGAVSAAGFAPFLRMATQALYDRGQAEIITLYHGDRAVASDLYLLGNGGAYCYMTGMDPAAAELAPGRLINANSILEAFQRGWHFLDFLRGDEPYKARLGCRPTAMLNCRATPPALLPRLRESVWNTQRRAKDLIRGMLKRATSADAPIPRS